METNEIVSLIQRIDNIKHVTSKLVEQSAKFAQYVSSAMEDAGVSSLLEGRLILTDHTSNVGRYDTLEYLYNCTKEDKLCYDVDISGDLLQTTLGEGHYIHGDFNSWVNCPDREDIVAFLNLSVDILTELAGFGHDEKIK